MITIAAIPLQTLTERFNGDMKTLLKKEPSIEAAKIDDVAKRSLSVTPASSSRDIPMESVSKKPPTDNLPSWLRNWGKKHAFSPRSTIEGYREYDLLTKGLYLPSQFTKECVAKAVAYCLSVISDKETPPTESEKTAIRTLFLQKLSNCSADVFPAHQLLGLYEYVQDFAGSIVPRNHANWQERLAFQCFLSPDLQNLYELEKEKSELANNPQHKLKKNLARAKLAADLGWGIEPTGDGQNGAAYIHSLESGMTDGIEEKLGVFKSPPKRTPFKSFGSLIESLKSYLGQRRLLHLSEPICESINEIAACGLSFSLGFDVAPPAEMVTMNNKQGAFIAYLNGCAPLSSKSYKKQLIVNKKGRTYSDAERTSFQKAVLFNFLCGNLDGGKLDNMFVYRTKDDSFRFFPIDFGNAFPLSGPTNFGSNGNITQIASLPLARCPITQEMKDFANNLDESKLEAFINDYSGIVKNYNGAEEVTKSSFFNKKQITLLKRRFRFLKTLVGTGKITDLVKIVDIQHKGAYNKYLKKYQGY